MVSKSRSAQGRNACADRREQAQTLLKAAMATPHGPVLAVALTTGMRPSEYLGLKWQDIECVQKPMTWSSKRRRDSQSVPIISPSISNQYSRWPVCHELNSTICATHRRQSRWQPGVSPKVVSEQLGHASTAFTLHICPRAASHAGRGCRKDRGNALWKRGPTVAEVAVLGTRYEQQETVRLYASGAEIGCVIRWFHAFLFSLSRLPTLVERTWRDHKGSCRGNPPMQP